MVFCTNCGKKLEIHDKYCSACGAENVEYRDGVKNEAANLDILIDAEVRLKGTKDEKTEFTVFVPQQNRTIRVLAPNFAEEGQSIRIRGEGLAGPNGTKGDLIVKLNTVEYFDTEMTISVELSGEKSESSRVRLYVPHMKQTVQISVPNNITTEQTLRLKGLGLDTPEGTRGDLYLHFDHIDFKQPDHDNEESAEEPAKGERDVRYDGKVHKCPVCGEIIDSFVSVCPACGHELRGTSQTSVVHEFAKKIAKVHATNEKDNLIRNFYIPNTKEDIIEFIILAVSNIESDVECRDAWAAKLEQIYQKARLTFGSSAEFEYVDELYNKAKKKLGTKRIISATGGVGKGILSVFVAIGKFIKFIFVKFFDLLKTSKGFRTFCCVVLAVALYFLVFFGPFSFFATEEREHKEHIEYLETLVVEVEDLIEEGNYDAARIKASQIVDDTGWSSESEDKWDNIRETLLDTIDRKEKESKKK